MSTGVAATVCIDYAAVAKQPVSCACCGADEAIRAVVGDRYNFGLQTVVCTVCGLIFTSPRPRSEWFEDFYRTYYRQFYDAVEVPDEAYVARDWIRARHEVVVRGLLDSIPSKGRLLDIGCAEGNFMHVFRQHRPGWEVFGIEPCEKFASFARSHYELEGVHIGTIKDLLEWQPGTFDLITANHSLEHLLDPNGLFRAAHLLLKEQGLLFVDVPDAEGRSGGIRNLHIAHVYHFSERTLRNFFVKHGFAVELAGKGSESPQWTFHMLARKESEPPERWRPPAVNGRAIARSFKRRCRPASYRKVFARLRRRAAATLNAVGVGRRSH